MLRSTILATVALAIGTVVVLGASQLRRGTQQSQPDFGTGTVTVTIANQPGVIVTNEPTVMAQQAGLWTVSLSDQRWTPKFGQVAKVDSDLRMERSESCRNGKNTPLS